MNPKRDQLFNCCFGFKEPCWDDYTQLELEPTQFKYCPMSPPDIQRCDDPTQAHQWSVYARHRDGLVDSITDIPLTSNYLTIVSELMKRSGLDCLMMGVLRLTHNHMEKSNDNLRP